MMTIEETKKTVELYKKYCKVVYIAIYTSNPDDEWGFHLFHYGESIPYHCLEEYDIYCVHIGYNSSNLYEYNKIKKYIHIDYTTSKREKGVALFCKDNKFIAFDKKACCRNDKEVLPFKYLYKYYRDKNDYINALKSIRLNDKNNCYKLEIKCLEREIINNNLEIPNDNILTNKPEHNVYIPLSIIDKLLKFFNINIIK